MNRDLIHEYPRESRFIALWVWPAYPDLPRSGCGTLLVEWFLAGGVLLVAEALFDERDQALRAEEVVEGGTQAIHVRDV